MDMENNIAQSFVDYKYTAIDIMRNSPDLMGLMLNDPKINMDSDKVFKAQDENFFDYTFADSTFQSDGLIIFVESHIAARRSDKFAKSYLYVQVVCNRDYCKINQKQWKGLKGNRRDNAAVIVANLLEGSEKFGVGDLTLITIDSASVPTRFTSIMLTFEIDGDWI